MSMAGAAFILTVGVVAGCVLITAQPAMATRLVGGLDGVGLKVCAVSDAFLG